MMDQDGGGSRTAVGLCCASAMLNMLSWRERYSQQSPLLEVLDPSEAKEKILVTLDLFNCQYFLPVLSIACGGEELTCARSDRCGV